MRSLPGPPSSLSFPFPPRDHVVATEAADHVGAGRAREGVVALGAEDRAAVGTRRDGDRRIGVIVGAAEVRRQGRGARGVHERPAPARRDRDHDRDLLGDGETAQVALQRRRPATGARLRRGRDQRRQRRQLVGEHDARRRRAAVRDRDGEGDGAPECRSRRQHRLAHRDVGSRHCLPGRHRRRSSARTRRARPPCRRRSRSRGRCRGGTRSGCRRGSTQGRGRPRSPV